jgi:hypothetical protein
LVVAAVAGLLSVALTTGSGSPSRSSTGGEKDRAGTPKVTQAPSGWRSASRTVSLMVIELPRSRITNHEWLERAKLELMRLKPVERPPANDEKCATFEERTGTGRPEECPDSDPPAGEYFLG